MYEALPAASCCEGRSRNVRTYHREFVGTELSAPQNVGGYLGAAYTQLPESTAQV